MSTLAETGRATNTLVIFTSDNGRSNREHRWEGKQVPYEESIRVPMIVRLPGEIPAGTVSRALVSNVDLAPTIADFAGTSISADGVSMRPLLTIRHPRSGTRFSWSTSELVGTGAHLLWCSNLDLHVRPLRHR